MSSVKSAIDRGETFLQKPFTLDALGANCVSFPNSGRHNKHLPTTLIR
jgi:hypothetical protein